MCVFTMPGITYLPVPSMTASVVPRRPPDGPTDEQVESAVAAYMKHYHDAEKRARLGRR